MTASEIIGYSLLGISLLEFFLGTVILRHNPRKSRAKGAVAAFSFFAGAFSLFTALMYLLAPLGRDVTPLARANWIGWLMIPAAARFVFFLRDENSRTARTAGRLLYLFWFAVLCASLSTDLIVTGDYSLIPYIDRSGPLAKPLRILGSLQIFWVLYELFRLKRTVTGLKKAQLTYFLHGMSIFLTGGTLIAGILPVFGGLALEPGLSSYFGFPWVVLTYYAMSRHRLFDVRLMVSRVVTTALLSAVFAALLIGLFALFETALGHTLSLLLAFSIISVVSFGIFFNRKAHKRIMALIERRRYDYQSVLRESIGAIATKLDLDELLGFIRENVQTSLDVEHARLLFRERNGRYSFRPGPEEPGRSRGSAALDERVVRWLSQVKRAVIREELEALDPGEDTEAVIASMKALGGEVAVPLIRKDRMHGVLILGRKKNGEPFTSGEIDLLDALSSQAAMAIENARLYEHVKRAKESLEESEGKFRALAQTTTAGILIHRGRDCLYANPVAESLTGYRREDFSSIGFHDIIHPAFRHMVQETDLSRLDSGAAPRQHELKIVTKNGDERWINKAAGWIDYGGKPAVIRTMFDITERKRIEQENALLYAQMEEKVRERTRELEEARKFAEAANKAKSDFLSNMTHELRTPLNAIIGFSEVMRDGATGPLTTDQEAYLKDIWESGKHLLRIINNILDLSKIDAGMMKLELDDFYLKELLEGSLSLFREKALRHRIALRAEIDEDVGLIAADKTKLKQVALNLLANAIKFTPDGGSVSLRARKVHGSKFNVRRENGESSEPGTMNAEPDADFVEISVADTGIGMSPEQCQQLFQPFLQLDNTLTKKYEGTGLGLHISRKIVELHNGGMWVESEPGKGSRFSFTIPVSFAGTGLEQGPPGPG